MPLNILFLNMISLWPMIRVARGPSLRFWCDFFIVCCNEHLLIYEIRLILFLYIYRNIHGETKLSPGLSTVDGVQTPQTSRIADPIWHAGYHSHGNKNKIVAYFFMPRCGTESWFVGLRNHLVHRRLLPQRHQTMRFWFRRQVENRSCVIALLHRR
jgi:hypothetical protein